MNSGSMIWFVIFLVSALLFFGIAAFAGINGLRDLKELLTETKKNDKPHAP